MKNKIVLSIMIVAFSGSCFTVNAQWLNKTMLFGGLTRSYRVYKSPGYNSSNPASLIIALHGLGDNMTNFSNIGLNYIADTANIICIFPQAVSDPFAGTAWNSRAGTQGYFPNSTVNDIGFINALVDTASVDYAINSSRVYLCGFSMGGFMTQRMALQSNAKFAAFGSMSGTIGNGITTFNPGRHVPIAHFHGTTDSTVFFAGNTYGMDADSLVKFWLGNNACPDTPTTFSYPDIANDNITVTRFEYSNGNPQSDVWFYKMYGAGHTLLFPPQNDIFQTLELWLFFRRHTLTSVGIENNSAFTNNIQIFPNPSTGKFQVAGRQISEIEVYNFIGTKILKGNNTAEIDLSAAPKGIYFVIISDGTKVYNQRIVVQ